MAEIRETLRLADLNLDELNRVMGRLQDRLDALEGLRGAPAFYSDVDLQEKRLLNVASITKETPAESTPTVAEVPTSFTEPVSFGSSVDVTGALSAQSTSAHTGHATFTTAVFSGAVTFNSNYVTFTYAPNIKTYSQATIPTTSELPYSGGIALWEDTSGGPDYYIIANIGGTIYSALLT